MWDRLLSVGGVLLGLIGLVILAALVVIGVDLRRARTRGPRWRRRLVAAGCALLASAGAYPSTKALPDAAGAGTLVSGRVVTCYMPGPPLPREGKLMALLMRLKVLSEHAERGTLNRPAVRKALDAARTELAALTDANSEEDWAARREARSMISLVEALMEKEPNQP